MEYDFITIKIGVTLHASLKRSQPNQCIIPWKYCGWQHKYRRCIPFLSNKQL